MPTCPLSLVALVLLNVVNRVQCVPVEAASQAEALNFMRKFGYIEEGDGAAQPLVAVDQLGQEKLENAIKEVQKFGGIPETGVLDVETMKLMSSKRCGVPDKVKGSMEQTDDEELLNENPLHPHHTHHHHHHQHHHHNHSHDHHTNDSLRRKKRYILATRAWDKRHLTYYLANSAARLSDEEVLGTFEEALNAWGRYGLLRFSQVTDPQVADITFSFNRRSHGDPYPFDGKGNVLAHAFFPGSSRDFEGDVHFDDEEDWRVNIGPYERGVDLYTVALHELGHSLGLSHSPNTGSVMNPYYRGSSNELGQDDILAMYNLYASKRLQDDSGYSASPPRSRPAAPRRPPTTTARPAVTPRILETTTTRRRIQGQGNWGGPRPSHGCFGSFDTVALIRNELFIIKDQLMWRLAEPGRVQPRYPVDFHTFFYKLPKSVKRIDAIYQRDHDSNIVMFTGQEYWVFDGNDFLDGRPFPISDYGLPRYIQKVDAAATKNNTAILFTGDVYWIYDERNKQLDPISPRPITDWGLHHPIDAAITYKDGKTYFFQGDYFWIYDDVTKTVKSPGHRERASDYWLAC